LMSALCGRRCGDSFFQSALQSDIQLLSEAARLAPAGRVGVVTGGVLAGDGAAGTAVADAPGPSLAEPLQARGGARRLFPVGRQPGHARRPAAPTPARAAAI
jgi:hypothetical protein